MNFGGCQNVLKTKTPIFQKIGANPINRTDKDLVRPSAI